MNSPLSLLLLLAMAGAAVAFTPGLEYRYRYEGKLGMGLPEIRTKFSGVGIKTLVTLQVQEPENVIIKLSDIEVGEYVGDVGVRVTNSLPIKYTTMPGEGKTLEEPFQVFFKRDRNEVMVVPASDPEWIVNLRKSIAQLFLVDPIRGNFGTSQVSDPTSKRAFTLSEPTLFGSACSVDYTVRPTDQRNAIHSADSHDEASYLMTRTINFNKCDEEVRLMHTSFGNFSEVSNTLFHNVASRSSLMTVKLVGKPGRFTIQEGNVQGYFSVNPFGVPTDKLMSMTNQTFFLESSSKIPSNLVVKTPTRAVKTWSMEVASPFSPPQHPTPFVNYYSKKDATYSPFMPVSVLTGIPISPGYLPRFQVMVEKLIEKSARLMFSVGSLPHGKISPLSTDEAQLTTMLDTATQVVFGIDVHRLEQLFEKYYDDHTEMGQMKLKLFIDVCAASGMNAPIKMLVDQMRNQRITPERITSIFVTLANNFVATPVIPDIMTFVKTLDLETHPFMTTNVWINFATTLRKVCVTRETIPFQIWGKEDCEMRMITNDFIPFFKEKFDNTHESFKRCSIVQSLANIGTPEAMRIISTIVEGDFDSTVRETAMIAFSPMHVKHVMHKDDVFDLLMPIVQNTVEDPVLRQKAIVVLLSWNPSLSWWHRLAASTWREPSNSVGAFIYYLIKNNYHTTEPMLSKQSRATHFLLTLTKPYPPSTTFLYSYGKHNPEQFSSMLFNAAVLNDDESEFPRSLYTLFANDFGGVKLPLFEAGLSSTLFAEHSETMMEQMINMFPEHLQKIIRTSPEKRAEIFKPMKPFLTKNHSQRESSLFVRMFEHLQFLAPFNSRTMPLPFTPESFDFLESLMNGKNLQLSKFFNPAPMEIFLPTELGIPFFGRLSAPTVQSAEGSVKFSWGEKKMQTVFDLFSSNSFTAELTTNYKFATKFIAEFQAILPWNEEMISAGVETMKSINMPSKMMMSMECQDNLRKISFNILPTQDKEFVGAYVHTIPYVARKSMYPGQLVAEYNDFEIISVDGNQQGIHKSKVVLDRDATGVDAAVHWQGDIPFPFTTANVYDTLNFPYKMMSKIAAPTTKLFSAAFVMNFKTSDTKAFGTNVAFTYPFFSREDRPTIIKKTGVTKNEEKVFVVRFEATGHENRVFEHNFRTHVISRDVNIEKSEMMYKYTRQFPGVKTKVHCVKVETRQPTFVDLRSFLKQLNSRNIDYSFSGKVRGGATCEDTQLATIKGVFKLSDTRKTALVEQITNELNINGDSFIDMNTEPFYDQTYVLIEYKEPLPSDFMNMTYHHYDVLRGSQFPHIYNDYYKIKNPNGRMVIEGERYVDRAWNLRIELPTENTNMDHFEVPFVYKFPVMFLFERNLFENRDAVLGIFNNHLMV